MTFGATVRELRQYKKLTLRKFAQLVELSPSYVSLMERDIQPPPSEAAIVRIAAVLDRDPDWLLAQAGKVSSELLAIIVTDPTGVARWLRRIYKKPNLKAPPV